MAKHSGGSVRLAQIARNAAVIANVFGKENT